MIRPVILFLQAVDDGLPALMVLAIILIMGSDIVLRDFFGTVVPSGVELSTFLFVWLIFLGGAHASRTGTHFSVNLLDRFMGPTGRIATAALVQLVCAAVAASMTWSSYFYMMRAWGRRAEALQIPLAVFYIVLPLSFGLMFLTHAIRLGLIVAGQKTANAPEAE